MSTDPLESIIYRDLAKANAQKLTEIADPLLTELVNFGSNAIVRCATSIHGKENEDLAVLSLYRHILEMTDGVQVLISQACAVPAIPLVRSSFEALISLDYIVESDQKYVARSLAWLVNYLNERVKTYEMLDPSTKRGKYFQRSIMSDINVSSMPLPPQRELQKAAARLNSLLSSQQLKQINTEFHNLKGKKAWYKLQGGPNNLRDLAHHVGRSALYDFIYRQWSRVTHAHDFGPFIRKDAKGQAVIRAIRSPEELKNVTNYSATICLAATRKLIGKFRPTENIKSWYERDVQPLYLQVFS
jgi:hypothetical protein